MKKYILLLKVAFTLSSVLALSQANAQDVSKSESSQVSKVNLLSFETAAENNLITVSWSTWAETNSKSFCVERSADAFNWENVAVVNGSGNSSNIQTYKVTDPKPFTGISYYRLKQIDGDGEITYSTIIDAELKWKGVNMFPNPAKDEVIVSLSENDKVIAVKIYNRTGKIVKQAFGYFDRVGIDISDLEPGVYFLCAESEGKADKVKLIKD